MLITNTTKGSNVIIITVAFVLGMFSKLNILKETVERDDNDVISVSFVGQNDPWDVILYKAFSPSIYNNWVSHVMKHLRCS